VKTLFGGEILPDEFLKVLFENDHVLKKLIPEMTYAHHQMIQMLLKEEYLLTACPECGFYSRNVAFNWRKRFQPAECFESLKKHQMSLNPSVEEMAQVGDVLVDMTTTREEETHELPCNPLVRGSRIESIVVDVSDLIVPEEK